MKVAEMDEVIRARLAAIEQRTGKSFVTKRLNDIQCIAYACIRNSITDEMCLIYMGRPKNDES